MSGQTDDVLDHENESGDYTDDDGAGSGLPRPFPRTSSLEKEANGLR